jgi:hypothetical protein
VTALLMLALTAVAAPAWAAGPLDGSYTATVVPAGGEFEPFTLYLVVLQKGSELGVALLEPQFGDWTYVFGPVDADNRLRAAITDPTDGTEAGQLDVRFLQNGTVTGSITYFDTPGTLSGIKFF